MMEFLSVFDRKAGSYSPAVCYPDVATAERSFVSLFADQRTTISQWPDDFDLYHLGTFNPADGAVVPLAVPVCVMTSQQAQYVLTDLRRKQEKGGAVGETSVEVAPEDKAATLPDGSSPVSDSASFKATPDLI